MEHPGFYAIIPATIRYNKTISSSAKLLYGEITALSNKQGFSWAKNTYFQELYAVKKNSVIRWINELIAAKVIYCEFSKNTRKIFLCDSAEGYQKCYGGVSKMIPRGIKNDTPINMNTTKNTTKNIYSPKDIPSGRKPNILIALPLPGKEKEIEISDIALAAWEENYPKVNIIASLNRMKLWLIANPKRRKTVAGIPRFINTWLAKEQDRPGTADLSAEAIEFGKHYLNKFERFKDPERALAWIDRSKETITCLFKIAGALNVAIMALDVVAELKTKLGYRWTLSDKSVSAMWPECVVKAEYKLKGDK